MQALYDRVTAPIIGVNSLDDKWIPPPARDAFIKHYRNSRWIGVDLDPRHVGIGPIGHMGYFRRPAEPLWSQALEWLDQQS